MKKITIKRGGIYLLDNEGAYGREITKRRPYIVVTAAAFTENTGFALVVPVTSSPHNEANGFITIQTNCSVLGQACWIQVKSVDLLARNPEYLGDVSKKNLADIRTAIKAMVTY